MDKSIILLEKDSQFSFRINRRIKETVKELAKKKGLRESAYLNLIILEALENEKVTITI